MMLKLETFIQQRIQEISGQFPEGPKLQLKRISSKRESFALEYSSGTVTLTASRFQDVCFGLTVLETALAAGYLAAFTGEYQPKFSLRPLWITAGSFLYQIENPEDLSALCFRILSLGYNAVLLEEYALPIEKFQECGLKVIQKINRDLLHDVSILDDTFCIPQINPSANYIFWESTIYQPHTKRHPRARDFLEEDLALREVSSIEKILPKGCRLIYSIPCDSLGMAAKQDLWIRKLCEEISPETSIAFPAVAGDPAKDHLSSHPLWESLRQGNEKSYYRFLPLVNIGSVNLGEGFWPAQPLDLISRYIGGSNPCSISGVISMSKYVPSPQALFSCTLWIAAFMQWQSHMTSESLAKTWFASQGCVYDARFFESIRSIVVDISLLRGGLDPSQKEEYRVLAESLFARLKYLQLYENHIHLPTRIKDTFTYFYRDARRLIFHFLQTHHLPMVCMLGEEDMEESFWTGITKFGNKAVILFDTPNSGKEGSLLRDLYSQQFAIEASVMHPNC